MNIVIELLKAVLWGIVEGITEWLPISSTGHMILLDEWIHLQVTPAFKEMFLVVIQLGAILAVLVIFTERLNPFSRRKTSAEKGATVGLWMKVIVSCLPAAVIGLLFDDKIDEMFYNYQTVALMLIVYGVLFIIVENGKKRRTVSVEKISDISYNKAFLVGMFQVLALIPGTSRSGATIIGALLLGMSRSVAAEYTFFLAIPVMFGASFLKLVKFGLNFTVFHGVLLGVGMITAFLVSLGAIQFLMGFIKKHDFKIFGYYRIILGIIVLLYFFMTALS